LTIAGDIKSTGHISLLMLIISETFTLLTVRPPTSTDKHLTSLDEYLISKISPNGVLQWAYSHQFFDELKQRPIPSALGFGIDSIYLAARASHSAYLAKLDPQTGTLIWETNDILLFNQSHGDIAEVVVDDRDDAYLLYSLHSVSVKKWISEQRDEWYLAKIEGATATSLWDVQCSAKRGIDRPPAALSFNASLRVAS
jgi:hypothetical protein